MHSLKDDSVRAMHFLWESVAGNFSFPFESDPHSPLQITGMLETRALDFDNVIMLSANEGVIPNKKNEQTLIPYDVRSHYQLPTFQHHEAIMTYHFYRLLQRAEQVYLLYNMDDRDEIREESRLLRQLELYWKGVKMVTIERKIFALPQVELNPVRQLQLPKEEPVLPEQFSFSPTAVNLYLSCPLQFCLHYLYQLQMPEEQTETIPANIMGTVIHKMLEKRISPDSLDLGTQNLETDLIALYRDFSVTGLHLTEEEILHEKNRLILELSLHYLRAYLQTFQKELGAEKNNPVQAVEEKIEQHPLLEANGRKIRFNGCIDRVDMEAGVCCIVDYKTGYVDEKKLVLQEMEDLFDGNHKEAIQLMLYMLYKHRKENSNPLCGKIIAMQEAGKSICLQINGKTLFETEDFAQFDLLMQERLFAPLFDLSQPFVPHSGDHCDYCPYANVCTHEP